jgi:hypothetical protein
MYLNLIISLREIQDTVWNCESPSFWEVSCGAQQSEPQSHAKDCEGVWIAPKHEWPRYFWELVCSVGDVGSTWPAKESSSYQRGFCHEITSLFPTLSLPLGRGGGHLLHTKTEQNFVLRENCRAFLLHAWMSRYHCLGTGMVDMMELVLNQPSCGQLTQLEVAVQVSQKNWSLRG